MLSRRVATRISRICRLPEVVGSIIESFVTGFIRFDKTTLRSAVIYKIGIASFMAANLRRAIFHTTQLKGTNFSQAKMEWSRFVSVTAERANFTATLMDSATFINCTLKCIIWHATKMNGAAFIQGAVRSCSFAKASMVGTGYQTVLSDCQFEMCNMQNSRIGPDTQFQNCTVLGTNMYRASLNRATIRKGTWRDIDLCGASILSSLFHSCNLTLNVRHIHASHTQFVNCAISFRDARDTFFDDVLFKDGSVSVASSRGATFCKSQFHGVSCHGNSFAGAEFDATAFDRSRFVEVNFTEATFHHVNFIGCSFNKVNFQGSHFNGVRFIQCVIEDVRFDNVKQPLLSFEGCSIVGSIFLQTDVTPIDFGNSFMQNVAFLGILQGFSLAQYCYISYAGAKLNRSTFELDCVSWVIAGAVAMLIKIMALIFLAFAKLQAAWKAHRDHQPHHSIGT